MIKLQFRVCYSFVPWFCDWTCVWNTKVLLVVLLFVFWICSYLFDYILGLRGLASLTPLLRSFFPMPLNYPMSSSSGHNSQQNDHSASLNPSPDLSATTEPAPADYMGRGSSANPAHSTPSTFATFSDALRFGVENQHSPVHPPSQGLPQTLTPPSVPDPPLSPNGGNVGSNLDPTPPCVPLPDLPDTPSNMDDLKTLCLLAKLWGESIPLPLIISKTKLDWKHVKGPVEYIELGHGWVLLKFATLADKEYVWYNRPWFVKGLNLVLSSWLPYFDPYSASVDRIDQWVRISRLPWEFWAESTLVHLLKPIGDVIRVDHNTLLRKKGRFARVCVNIDVSKPLPGTLSIPTPKALLRIPITYEGLHEVCALCGGGDHLLELCPRLPVAHNIEVVVEKFEAHGLADPPNSAEPNFQAESSERWIRISPKKRGRSFHPSLEKKPTHSGIRIQEPLDVPAPPPNPSPAVLGSKDKGKAILSEAPSKQTSSLHSGGATQPGPCPPPLDPGLTTAAPPFVPGPAVAPLSSPPLPVGEISAVHSPTSPLQATEVFSSPSNVSPSIHPSGEDLMEQDGDDDFFLDLDEMEDPAISSDSVKKRKIEDGEECSSRYLD